MKEHYEYYMPGGGGLGAEAGDGLCDVLGAAVRMGNPHSTVSSRPQRLPDLSEDIEEFCTEMMRDMEEECIDGGIRCDVTPPAGIKK